MQLVLPRTLRRLRPRLCHFTNFTAPLMTSTTYVLSVHDMSLFLFNRTQAFKHLIAARGIIPQAVRRAAAVITLSESARRDVLDVLQAPPERVRVVYCAAGPQFRPLEDAAELDRVRRRYRLPESFILHVGTLEPRKNLPRLFDAWVRLQEQGRRESLVLAGQLGWKYGSLLRAIAESRFASRVHVLQYVDARDLPALYNLARVVALPSLYEGFGLPILEAMASGVPVMTSNRAATMEIAGGAAALVDPERTDELVEALAPLIDDGPLRSRMREAGLHRAAEFSWKRTAEQTAAIYREFQ
jgi:glycosyltransferase involved in cell wall biosynthesis